MEKIFTRTHKIYISRNHKYYKILDEICFKSKNLYNLGLYTSRQNYFETNRFLINAELQRILKNTEAYKELQKINSQLPQANLLQVNKNTKSFSKALKQYYNKPESFLGKPKLPRYKDKIKGRFQVVFSYLAVQIKNNFLHVNSCDLHFELPKYLKDLEKPLSTEQLLKRNSIEQNLVFKQLRISPRINSYLVEIVYDKTIRFEKQEPNYRVASIDLGIDNFSDLVTNTKDTKPLLINGKHLKSYNKNFNKRLADLKSKAKTINNIYTTKQIQSLYLKREKYFNTKMHQISSFIVKYLKENNIQQLVVGYNKEWKQESKLSRIVNQTFIQFPYRKFLGILNYKCLENNINYIEKEESYTSGTSFLDKEPPEKQFYNKSRRIYRGLFKTNTGKLVNADINSAFQIMTKAFPKFRYSEVYELQIFNPVRVTI